MKLDADQLSCTEAPLGTNVLVNAGPGAGKTRVLTQRYIFLRNQGVSKDDIVLITFTNKSAREMMSRIAKETEFNPDYTGTFHHYSYVMMKAAGQKFIVLDDYHQVQAAKRVCKELGYKNIVPAEILSRYSYSRNAMTQLVAEPDEHRVIQGYEEYKASKGLVDFDDLLVGLYKLFRDKYQPKGLKYVLVDEFQDTNKLQMEMLKLMYGFGWLVYGVGDCNQSIYGFRAANIENIMNFPTAFAPTLSFDLGRNYRSTKQIVNIYAEFIKNNDERIPVELVADLDGQKPIAVVHQDPISEANSVARLIKRLYKQGSVSVLYRANFQSPHLEKFLLAEHIPYVVRGKVKFFEQAHILPVVDLGLFLHKRDPRFLQSVLRLFPGVGEKTAFHLANLISVGEYNKCVMAVPAKHRTAELDQFVKYVATEKDYKKVLIYYIVNHLKPFVEEKLSNIDKRQDDLKLITEYVNTSKSSEEFLELISVSTPDDEEEANVILSTIHSAKGLEWDYTIVLGIAQNVFPHPKSVAEGTLEEERRLMYVAMSRPRRILFLSFVGFSQFARELNHDCVDFRNNFAGQGEI